MELPNNTKPFVIGMIAGAVAVTLLGFTNGWIVTADANSTQVRDASINAQAAVCAALVDAHLKITRSTVNLEGYQADASKARNDLARSFAVALPGDKTADAIVVTACAQMLNKPKA
jgi:hypothetical protein